jgi:nucleotide-binding universal stress UspA family protein
MTSTNSIVVATDFSPNSDLAVIDASERARATGARLVVCHVLPDLMQVRPLFPQLRLEDAMSVPDLQNRVADAAASRVSELTGRQDDFDVAIEVGAAENGILDHAERLGAGTIVLGAHGKAGAGGFHLGSVAKRVVRHARCDVLVVRPSPRGAVLAGTDFSGLAKSAVDRAVREAEHAGTELLLVYCLDFIPPGLALPTVDVPMPGIGALLEIRQETQRLLDEESTRVRATPLLREGPAPLGICEAAKEHGASLVVVGTHGRKGLGRFALGSVAETVVERSPCSVLVVRSVMG